MEASGERVHLSFLNPDLSCIFMFLPRTLTLNAESYTLTLLFPVRLLNPSTAANGNPNPKLRMLKTFEICFVNLFKHGSIAGKQGTRRPGTGPVPVLHMLHGPGKPTTWAETRSLMLNATANAKTWRKMVARCNQIASQNYELLLSQSLTPPTQRTPNLHI